MAEVPTAAFAMWQVALLAGIVAIAALSAFYFSIRSSRSGTVEDAEDRQLLRRSALFATSIALLALALVLVVAAFAMRSELNRQAIQSVEKAYGVAITEDYGQRLPLSSDDRPTPVVVEQGTTLVDCTVYARAEVYNLKCYYPEVVYPYPYPYPMKDIYQDPGFPHELTGPTVPGDKMTGEPKPAPEPGPAPSTSEGSGAAGTGSATPDGTVTDGDTRSERLELLDGSESAIGD